MVTVLAATVVIKVNVVTETNVAIKGIRVIVVAVVVKNVIITDGVVTSAIVATAIPGRIPIITPAAAPTANALILGSVLVSAAGTGTVHVTAVVTKAVSHAMTITEAVLLTGNCIAAIHSSVNIKETPDAFTIACAIPGSNRQDCNIEVGNGVLWIGAAQATGQEDEAAPYVRREFVYHAFKRAFKLPASVNAAAITAKYENGIVWLLLPKKEGEALQPRRKIVLS